MTGCDVMPTREAVRRSRRRLDERLHALQPAAQYATPRSGWVRAIREALGMSLNDLGARMGVSPQTVQSLEKSEQADRAQLATLRPVGLLALFEALHGLRGHAHPGTEVVQRHAQGLADRPNPPGAGCGVLGGRLQGMQPFVESTPGSAYRLTCWHHITTCHHISRYQS